MSKSFRRGFVPARSQTGGGGAPRSKLYPTNTDLVQPLGIGDPVCMINGYVQRWTTANASAFLGIVRACYDANKKPLTFSLPNQAPYLPASTAGWVDVMDDPDQALVIECAASVGQSMIGGFATVEISAVNTNTGISNFFAAGVTAADATGAFRVVGLAPSETATTAAGSPNNDIEVLPVLHVYK